MTGYLQEASGFRKRLSQRILRLLASENIRVNRMSPEGRWRGSSEVAQCTGNKFPKWREKVSEYRHEKAKVGSSSVMGNRKGNLEAQKSSRRHWKWVYSRKKSAGKESRNPSSVDVLPAKRMGDLFFFIR